MPKVDVAPLKVIQDVGPPVQPELEHKPAPRANPSLAGIFQNLLTILGLAAIGVLAWAYSNGRITGDQRHTLPPEAAAEVSEPVAIAVTAEPITVRPLKRTIEAVGTLFGFEELVVSAKVEGRVLSIQHDVSDRIAPGELLATIDPTDLKLSVDQAENNLLVELAKLGLTRADQQQQFELEKLPTVLLAKEKLDLSRLKMERIQSLAQRQATTQEGVDNAVSEFRMAGAEYENQLLMAKSSLAMIKARQSALAISQQQLVDSQIKAPTPQLTAPSGDQEKPYVMTKRSIAEGSFVRVGDEVCRLAIDGTLKLRVAVPERHSAQIALGQRVQVLTQSSKTPFDGTVTMINPAVDSKTRTFQVEVQVPNDRPGLKPGGFAKAVIEISEDPEARTIPLAAMLRYAGVIKLFLLENGTAKEVQFTPGIQTREWVEVASPKLPADAIVITSGQYVLAEGTPVTVRKPAQNSAQDVPEKNPSAH